MKFLFSLILGGVALPAVADTTRHGEETVILNFTLREQTCRLIGDANLCSSSTRDQRVTMYLRSVVPNALESRAFEGESPMFAMSMDHGAQFMPRVTVRKSEGMEDTTPTYVLRFRADQISAQTQPTAPLETVHMSEESLRLPEPLPLTFDKEPLGDRGSRTYTLTVRPAVVFASVVEAD